MRLCSICLLLKTTDFFGINKSKKDGLMTYCKECSKEKTRIYRKNNLEKCKKSTKNWKDKNISKTKEYRKEYYKENRKKERIQSKKYREKNKEKIAKKEKEYRESNREIYLNKKKEYFQKFKHKHAKYISKRRKNDPNYRLLCSLRDRVRGLLKGFNKNVKTLELVGCSMEELWLHLEKQFTEGMTRNNHGKYGWHVDHIRPCCSFDLTDIDQQKICFHYSNLQPLWAEDNLKKGSKII